MSTVKTNAIEPASGGTVAITGAALTTPALGTPASGTLTNCTGLPASAVVNTPSGGISATTVQAALEELDSEKFDKAGGTITGPTVISHASADTNSAEIRNTSATGYGLFSRGGSSTRYAAIFVDYSAVNQLMLLSGTGALTVAQGGTFGGTTIAPQFQATGGAPGFSISNQATNAARSQYVNDGGTFYLGLDSSAGGLGGAYTVNYFYTGNYAHVWSTNSAEKMRLTAGGLLLVGATTSSGYGDASRISRSGGQGANILAIDGGVEVSGIFQAVSGAGANTADSALRLGKNTVTNRSINAGGTINASGADAAEYRKNNGLTIAKGQIVGYKNDGTLTLTWSQATMARVKSTDPHIVGGDTWGTEDQVGARPVEPNFTPPQYTGRVKPADLAAEPQAPAQFTLTAPVNPGDDAGAVAAAVYALALRDYTAAQQAYTDSVSAHLCALTAWRAASDQHAQAMTAWTAAQTAHTAAVQEAQETFDTVTLPAYRAALAAFETRLEAARQQVDRIAYCGIVPCNVTGATPGHYIVAAEGPNGTIIGRSVEAPQEAQWRWVVGRCLRVLPDGRAEIDVMLS